MTYFFKKYHAFFPILLCVIATVGLLLFTEATFAQNDLNGAVLQQIKAGGVGAELGEAVDPRIVIANLIQVLLLFTGTFFLFLVILSGYWWMTDRGEGVKLEKAKKTLTRAVIGLIVVLLAYAITLLVSNVILTSVRGDQRYRIENRSRTRCIVGGPECFFQGGL